MKCFLPLLFSAAAFAAQYEIDTAHSSANFTVTHMMVTKVRGNFSGVSGKVVYDPKNVAATTVEASIHSETVNTNQAKRDAHLKSPDFFEVAKFPALKFVSTKVTPAGKGRFKVAGDLTMHGVTKPVVLDVTGPTAEVKDGAGAIRTGATATTKINRTGWGLTWNKVLEAGGLTVSEEVAIELDLQFVKK